MKMFLVLLVTIMGVDSGPSTKAPLVTSYRSSRPLTACENLRSTALDKAVFIPECKEDGGFHIQQCTGDNVSKTKVCWCVDPRGQEIKGTRLMFPKVLDCYLGSNLKSCVLQMVHHLHGLLGAYKPTCTDSGEFERVQCLERECWCVDTLGNKRPGSAKTDRTQLNCSSNKIEIVKAPNAIYDVEPNMEIVIAIDAITDPDWQNQMSYKWFWYFPFTTPTGDKIIEKHQLPPTTSHGKYFKLSLSDKELTLTIPDVKTPVMEGNTAEYDLYQDLTDDRLFSINISHKFDHQVVNFTVKGKELEKPMPVTIEKPAGFIMWPIWLTVGIVVWFIFWALIYCYYKRNRGETASLDNEEEAENNPEQELEENVSHNEDDDLNDVSRDEETGLNAEAQLLSTDIEEADIGKGSEVQEDGSDNIVERPLNSGMEDANIGSEFVEDGSDEKRCRIL